MNAQTKQEKSAFFFETIDAFFDEKIQLILSELKPDSILNKEVYY